MLKSDFLPPNCFSANPHQSETEEQQEYEKLLLTNVHHLDAHFDSDRTTSSGYPLDSPSPPSHPLSVESDSTSPASSDLNGKLKGFWTNTLKPAFPEAITDIKLAKEVFSAEALVSKDLHDATRYPEIKHVAEVRRGVELCSSEKLYLAQRKLRVSEHFAKYLGLDPAQVHPDDVPTIAFGGSGGGYRAMLGMLGYSIEMKRRGLWDLLTYVAGVSGSCWTLASYYTFAAASMDHVLAHCMNRLSPHHPLSNEAIRMTLAAQGGSYTTLGPLVQKHRSGLHIVIMDLYSVFTTGYLFLHGASEPEAEADRHRRPWYKWSSAQKWLENGAEPLPILTAIRHERPWKDWVDKENPFKDQNPTSREQTEIENAWFQWFEMTPYEIGCDEHTAWVPTWGFGRPFQLGKSTIQLPEQSLALLLGLCTSAPAGPLTSYLATIKRNLPPGSIANLVHDLATKISHLWGKQRTEEFVQHHPLHACNEHNYMFRLTPVLKGHARPPGIENSPRIHLIDSGLDNNCPTYVLLRPEREIDVILNMDASSDVQKDSFQERIDQMGSRRGLKYTKRHDLRPDPNPTNPDRFNGLYAQIYDGVPCERPETVVDSYGHTVTNPPGATCLFENTVIYLPLLPNERVAHDFDPSTAKFSGSYNLIWTPEQVEILVNVARANFVQGEKTIKLALMDAYLRKKAKRESGKVSH